MAWYNDSTVPSNPIAIWDSSQMVSGVMQDRIGTNHLDMRGGVTSVKSIFEVTSVTTWSGVSGTKKLLTLPTPIALTGGMTTFYIGSNVIDSGSDCMIAFHNGQAITTDLMGFVNGNSSGSLLQCRKSNASFNSTLGIGNIGGAVWFYAVSMDGTTARQYANGRWVDDGFDQSMYIMNHIKGVSSYNADNSPYCLSNNDLMCAAGVYGSPATLAQLQSLEALVRAAYTIESIPVISRTADIQAQRQPLITNVPVAYGSYLTAKEGDVSEDRMFVYRSGIWVPVSGINVTKN